MALAKLIRSPISFPKKLMASPKIPHDKSPPPTPKKVMSPRPNSGSSTPSRAASPPIRTDLPELNHGQYLASVLQLASDEAEAALEDDLFAKATALGISTRQPLSLNIKALAEIESIESLLESEPSRTPSQRSSVQTVDTDTSAVSSIASDEAILNSPNSASGYDILCGPAAPGETPVTLFRWRAGSVNFSIYEKYIEKTDPIGQQKFVREDVAAAPSPATGLERLGLGTKKSLSNIKRGLKAWRTGRAGGAEGVVGVKTCVCCREELTTTMDLPCGHTYCTTCLRAMVDQSMAEEARMPPRCCFQPIPSSTIQSLLPSRTEKKAFIRKVVQFSVPYNLRLFCPNAKCGEFIIPRRHPKHPFEAVCLQCSTHVCTQCQREAHARGKDCPEDKELEAVLRLGESVGWRRCYKCRNLVELSFGCTHMTCRCSAQFCYLCGAVWSRQIGCPNLCIGEEELEIRHYNERRRIRAETDRRRQLVEQKAQFEAAARLETSESAECRTLQARQEAEAVRYRTHHRKARWIMWARHSHEKLGVMERYAEQVDRMRDRHERTVLHLEDRQVAVEMEMLESQAQTEKSVLLRLRHMEAYCSGLGSSVHGNGPTRTISERDLLELGSQYRIRDNMKRLHQSRINVLRDQQAKSMESLISRHADELDRLDKRRDLEMEGLAARFAQEENTFAAWFEKRAAQMKGRWAVECAIVRRVREEATGRVHWPMDVPVLVCEEEEEGGGRDGGERAKSGGVDSGVAMGELF